MASSAAAMNKPGRRHHSVSAAPSSTATPEVSSTLSQSSRSSRNSSTLSCDGTAAASVSTAPRPSARRMTVTLPIPLAPDSGAVSAALPAAARTGTSVPTALSPYPETAHACRHRHLPPVPSSPVGSVAPADPVAAAETRHTKQSTRPPTPRPADIAQSPPGSPPPHSIRVDAQPAIPPASIPAAAATTPACAALPLSIHRRAPALATPPSPARLPYPNRRAGSAETIASSDTTDCPRVSPANESPPAAPPAATPACLAHRPDVPPPCRRKSLDPVG